LLKKKRLKESGKQEKTKEHWGHLNKPEKSHDDAMGVHGGLGRRKEKRTRDVAEPKKRHHSAEKEKEIKGGGTSYR